VYRGIEAWMDTAWWSVVFDVRDGGGVVDEMRGGRKRTWRLRGGV
jgi:hypothetical protein